MPSPILTYKMKAGAQANRSIIQSKWLTLVFRFNNPSLVEILITIFILLLLGYDINLELLIVWFLIGLWTLGALVEKYYDESSMTARSTSDIAQNLRSACGSTTADDIPSSRNLEELGTIAEIMDVTIPGKAMWSKSRGSAREPCSHKLSTVHSSPKLIHSSAHPFFIPQPLNCLEKIVLYYDGRSHGRSVIGYAEQYNDWLRPCCREFV
jgi:hypothetical protein